ncbi:uncharacterized protein LOC128274245 [Anopheles cruzii]|uniref:uncharacterized protein LOC128274245 n=1 Tax=Anopheles cruzii TaxID=68878 RepID=UPI0022EC72D4|nr:uncharacterized protein LOC128274245 [Anopheles cruzii]
MATARSFGLQNQANRLKENQASRKPHQLLRGLKASDAPVKFGLKDVTNNNQKPAERTNVFKDGKTTSSKRSIEKSLNAIQQSIMPSTAKKPTAGKGKMKFDIFTPLEAEYKWGASDICLRDDLFEEMVNFQPSTERKREPLPPPRLEPLDFAELDETWDIYGSTTGGGFSPPNPMQLPANDFPMVDLQDLEFMM